MIKYFGIAAVADSEEESSEVVKDTNKAVYICVMRRAAGLSPTKSSSMVARMISV
jgi:hypothetical protein